MGKRDNICQITQGAASDHGTLISSALVTYNRVWQVLFFCQLYSKFQLWCHNILIVSFIYLIRTELSHSMKLWCHRTSLIVCVLFWEIWYCLFQEKYVLLYANQFMVRKIWPNLQQDQNYLNLANYYLEWWNSCCNYFKKMISCFKQKYAWLVKGDLSEGQVKYCLKEVMFYLF